MDIETYLKLAKTYKNQGKWEDAIACYQQITEFNPNYWQAYHEWGEALSHLKRWQDAIKIYRQALTINPSSEWSHYKLGDALAQLKRWDKAIASYRDARQLNRKLPLIHKKLGEALQKQALTTRSSILDFHLQEIRRDPNKIFNYHKALEIDAKNVELYLGLANALVKKNKLDEAIVIYQIALNLNSNVPKAYLNLGKILVKQGKNAAATECLNKALKLEPDLTKVDEYFKLGNTLMKQGKNDQAADFYLYIIQIKPDFFQAYHRLAQALVAQEKWNQAISVYQKLIQLQSDNWEAYHELGDTFLNNQQWQKATVAYRRAIELNPNFSWSYNNLGDALLKLKQWEEAIPCFRRAIKLNPDFPWSYYNLAEAYRQLKEWNKAIASYRRALKLFPNMPYITRNLGLVLHERAKSDLEEAFNFYQLIIKQEPTDLEIYRKAQEIVKILGKTELLSQGRIASHSPNLYDLWIEENTPKTSDLQQMSERISEFKYQPLISIIVPVYNTPEKYLNLMIQSVIAQIYPDWELCIADDASAKPHVKNILKKYLAQDERIKVIFSKKNGHISAASNSALRLATGEFVALLDHDDLLAPDALYEVALLLNKYPDADMIYSDEDQINDQGERVNPFFKPDWCPDSFLSRMYTRHLGTYRRSLINQIGGFRLGYEESQDYDLVLRFTEKTNKIFHIPKILYHWRIHDDSAAGVVEAQPYPFIAGKKALEDALIRRGEPGKVISNNQVPGVYTVRYKINDYKLVSIIIPTRNFGDVLDKCLESIFTKSTYPNYQVIIIDNGTDDTKTMEIFSAWEKREPHRFSCHRLDIPFNYSRLNNFGVSQAKADYLLFLNNDTEVITPDWIEAMVEQAQRPSIGAVGVKLLYPDDTIQHAGVILGIGRIAGHSNRYFPANDPGYLGQLLCVNNYSAVTAACLMCRSEVFKQVGGFDETLKVAFNDVDFCLKIKQQGYDNVCLPHVELYHYESKSRGYEDTLEKQQRFPLEVAEMEKRWGKILSHDPCYNVNLTSKREDYSLKITT